MFDVVWSPPAYTITNSQRGTSCRNASRTYFEHNQNQSASFTSNTNTNHFAIIVSQWLQLAVVLYSQSMHQPLILFIILHIFIINITIIHQTMAESSSNKRPKLMDAKANVLMVGTGEYTTGYVGGTASDSDKGAGVVALTMFDLRRRGKVERVGMCGVNVGNYLYLLLLC